MKSLLITISLFSAFVSATTFAGDLNYNFANHVLLENDSYPNANSLKTHPNSLIIEKLSKYLHNQKSSKVATYTHHQLSIGLARLAEVSPITARKITKYVVDIFAANPKLVIAIHPEDVSRAAGKTYTMAVLATLSSVENSAYRAVSKPASLSELSEDVAVDYELKTARMRLFPNDVNGPTIRSLVAFILIE
jgi:hypothetical protein